MKKIDTTNFMRIQLPLMLLANLMLFLGMLFLSPDWVFGIPQVYPPYLVGTNVVSKAFTTVSNVSEAIAK